MSVQRTFWQKIMKFEHQTNKFSRILFIKMQFIWLSIAIFNLSSLVLRAVFTTQPHPIYQQGGQHSWTSVCFDTGDNICFDTEKGNVNNDWTCSDCVTQNVHNNCSTVNGLENGLYYSYSKDQLLCVNGKAHHISNVLMRHLNQLGIRNKTCGCESKKKRKRGKRGGQRKQRQIQVVINTRVGDKQEVLPQSQHKSLISIDTSMSSIDPSKHLKILLFNTQSARKKTILLNDLIHESNADIVFFTESWFRPEGDEVLISDLVPPGYKAIPFPRESGGGGGICLIYRPSLKITAMKISDYSTFECCECIVTIKGHSFPIACIYRPPPSPKNKLKTKDFFPQFQSFLEHHMTYRIRPIILGDFNFHFDDPNDSDVKKILPILEAHGLIQVIDKPTHVKGHILDWVLTDAQNKVNNIQISDKCLSDHFVISFEMELDKPGPVKRTITARSKDINHELFKNSIVDAISSISDGECNKVEAYNTIMAELHEQYAPLRSRTVTDRSSAPWMSLEIKQAKSERRRAERQWRSSKLQVFKDIFRNCNNKVKALIASAKRNFYNNQIAECCSSKTLFSLTNTMFGKTNDFAFPSNVNKAELPNVFAKYFSEKISSIRKKLDSSAMSLPHFEPFHGNPISNFSPVTQTEVLKIIKLSPPKSCCLDPIPTPLLVQHIDSLAEVITNVVNDSLRSGIVPHSFKHAVVSPLLKKSNLSPNELKNFRPVSNLPFLSKILEKVVLAQLKSHFANNNLYEIFQSAYREFHNTETALLKVHNDLLCEAEKGNVSILALLDLSAAFDTIDHTVLLDRLEKSFGLSGTVLTWFKSYLIGRSQCVQVFGNKSSHFTLEFGVPQGSVLGPFLYTLYTQPLGTIIRSHNMFFHMYADDTQLYQSAPPCDVKELAIIMEHCIDDVKNWMVVNKLKMNEEKTELLLCDPKKKCDTAVVDCISIENEKIPFNDKAKNLGVYFDCNLSMQHHLNFLCKALYCELRKIGHMASFLNEHSLKTLVSSFVLSRIDYCNSLLSNLPVESLNRLQRFQNHAAKIVLRKKKTDHVTPLLIKLHWLPVQPRIFYKIAILCHKCLNGKAPSYLKDLIQVYVPPRSLRSVDKMLLKVPKKGSKKLADRSFVHNAPSVWNSLPLSLRQITSETQFKTGLKTHLMRSL